MKVYLVVCKCAQDYDPLVEILGVYSDWGKAADRMKSDFLEFKKNEGDSWSYAENSNWAEAWNEDLDNRKYVWEVYEKELDKEMELFLIK